MLADNEIIPPCSWPPSSTETEKNDRLPVTVLSTLSHHTCYSLFPLRVVQVGANRWALMICRLLLGCLQPNQFTRSNCLDIVGFSNLLCGNYGSWFQCFVAFRIRDGVIWVLACQGLMSLHFPTLSQCDAWSMIGMWREREYAKRKQKNKVFVKLLYHPPNCKCF